MMEEARAGGGKAEEVVARKNSDLVYTLIPNVLKISESSAFRPGMPLKLDSGDNLGSDFAFMAIMHRLFQLRSSV